MREILFRGKRTDNGEWAKGHITIDTICAENDTYLAPVIRGIPERIYSCDWCEVIPDTVGQFTGLTDKNGKHIFEGDFVRCIRTMCDEKSMVGHIVYDECCFSVKDRTSANQPAMDLCDDFEVIGNIHDNPELLEGE